MNPPNSAKAFCENVEFFTFINNKLCYRGHCKIFINDNLQKLHVVPSEKEATEISASFDWNFVIEENILFVESPFDVHNFVLVFDDPFVSRKVYNLATKNMFINVLAKQRIFKQKFFIPFLDELNNPKETEILAKFLGFCSDVKKRGYLDMVINKKTADTAVNRNQEVIYLNRGPSTSSNCNRTERGQQVTFLQRNPMVPGPQMFTHRKRHYPPADDKVIECYDDDSDEPIIIDVIPKKPKPMAPPIPETYITYDFKLVEIKIKEKTKQKLYIFSDDDNTKCHTYVKKDSETLFNCHDCRFRKKAISTAVLKTNSQGKDYVEVKPNGHPCVPKEYVPGRHAKRIMIKKPEYEVVDAFIKNSKRQRLIVFDHSNRELCYEYFPHRNAFQCGGCVKLRKDTRAQIYHDGTDKEYVELYTTDHICELRAYNPEKFSKPQIILKKPEYEIQTVIKNGKELKRLIVFDQENNEYCYEYVLRSFGFACKECLSKQHTVSAVLTKEKNDEGEEEEICRLGHNQHICETIPYVAPEEKDYVTISSEDFEVIADENKVVIYDIINRDLTYEFIQSSGDLYYCSRCKLKKHHFGIKLVKNDDDEYCIKMDADLIHVCDPQDDREFLILQPKIVKSPNFLFYLNDEGKQRLAVFTDDDRTQCYTYYLINTDNKKKFLCGGCSTFDRRPSARLWKNDTGEIYLELGTAEHICAPKDFASLEQTIVKKLRITDFVKPKIKNDNSITDFELRSDKKGERDAVLLIFHSKDKKLCYEFKHQKFNNKYRCIGCEQLKIQVTAKLIVDENEKKYVIMGHNEHYCKPIKYQAEPPKFRNFLLFENDAERRGSKLIVFTSEERKEYHEYSLWKGQKYFHCLGCYPMRSTIAKLFKDEKGENFVEFGKVEHVCKPKVYDSEKFGENIRVPDYQYEMLPNLKAEPDTKIIVFSPATYSTGFDYVPDKFFCCFKCRSLKKYVIAKFVRTESGERFLELSKNEHVCEAHNFLDVGRIYYEPDFMHDIDYDGNHTVTTICPENREAWYKFAYDKDLQCFYCIQCKEEKKKFTAAKIKVCHDKQLFILAYSHCCTPLSL